MRVDHNRIMSQMIPFYKKSRLHKQMHFLFLQNLLMNYFKRTELVVISIVRQIFI